MCNLPPTNSEHNHHSQHSELDLLNLRSLAHCSTEPARGLITLEQALEQRVLPLMVLSPAGGLPMLRCVAESRESLQQDQLIKTLRFLVGREVHVTWLNVSSLEDTIVRAYLGGDELLRRGFDTVAKSKASVRETPFAPPQLEHCESDVGKLLTTLLHFAAVRGASDLHLCPGQDGSIIKLRIDGMLLIQNGQPYARVVHDQLVARVKILSFMDPAKRQIPQDGSFRFTLPNKQRVSARVSSIPTLYGESVVIRFLLGESVPSIAELRLEEGTSNILHGQLKKRGGLIILTGPTGSGKSTTLYACVDEVRKMNRNVITIEDPIEQVIAGVSQVQLNSSLEVTYASAIKASLRHDPDVLLIGEIRDRESACGALAAASTGHLTLTTLHVGSALDTLDRFTALGIPLSDVISQLLIVVNQRLLPRLCSDCRVVDLSATRTYGGTVYQRVGCPSCSHTGYNGRVLATETLCLDNPASKEALRRSSGKVELLTTLPAGAWTSWMTSLQKLLLQGLISAEQFGRFVEEEFR